MRAGARGDGLTVVKLDIYQRVFNWMILSTAIAVSLSVENAENGGLHILNTYAHRNYIVLACTDKLSCWNSWESSFSSAFLFLLNLHWQLIGTLTQRDSNDLTPSILLEHILSDFLRLNFSQTVCRSFFVNRKDRAGRFDRFFNPKFWITLLFFRVITFFFLLFWLTLDFSKSILIVGSEVLMMKIAFLTVFSYFVEVVHVELNESRVTCLTNDE